MTEPSTTALGCDVPGHPQHYAHDCLPDAGEHLEHLTGDGWHTWPYGHLSALVRRLDDEHHIAVIPFLFTWGVVIGDHWSCYIDRWCYHDLTLAVAAATVWNGDGDPLGWHRHPSSGRRRPEGDPTREYVEP